MSATPAHSTLLRMGTLACAVAWILSPVVLHAQAMDHSQMQMPMPAAPRPPAQPAKTASETPPKKATAKKAAPASSAAAQPMDPAMDHAGQGQDMSAMPNGTMPSMDHSAMAGMSMAPTEPITPIPVLTDADRAAAAPPTGGPDMHSMMHDDSLQSFVLFDRLEAWSADPGTGTEWDAQAWFGTDLNRLWLRSEGERIDGRTESADLEVLYGRAVATWWDVVVGVRHDFKPGDSQNYAAIGVIGLAPQKFEVEATVYVGERGQTAARLEAEYDVLLTNRLILQPLVEANLQGKNDSRRGIGSGLSTIEAGFRLRYEITRRFAPYLGFVRERAFGQTADYRRADGDDIDDTRVVAGVRVWF